MTADGWIPAEEKHLKPGALVRHATYKGEGIVEKSLVAQLYGTHAVRFKGRLMFLHTDHLEVPSVQARWAAIAATSPSGKTQFVCLHCGRVSVTPDKECPNPYTIVLGGISYEHRCGEEHDKQTD